VDWQKHIHVHFIHVGTLFIRAHVVRSVRRLETPGINPTYSTELYPQSLALASVVRGDLVRRWR